MEQYEHVCGPEVSINMLYFYMVPVLLELIQKLKNCDDNDVKVDHSWRHVY